MGLERAVQAGPSDLRVVEDADDRHWCSTAPHDRQTSRQIRFGPGPRRVRTRRRRARASRRRSAARARRDRRRGLGPAPRPVLALEERPLDIAVGEHHDDRRDRDRGQLRGPVAQTPTGVDRHEDREVPQIQAVGALADPGHEPGPERRGHRLCGAQARVDHGAGQDRDQRPADDEVDVLRRAGDRQHGQQSQTGRDARDRYPAGARGPSGACPRGSAWRRRSRAAHR